MCSLVPEVDHDWRNKAPWNTEPDANAFMHEGFLCFMVRNSEMGSWCGYVEVPRDHPWYEKPYDDIEVEVHGGLTYAKKSNEAWRIGFDCAHYMDLIPFIPLPDSEYRTYEFVVEECRGMAKQAKEVDDDDKK